MSKYQGISTQEFLDLATNSSSELACIGERLMDYETGESMYMDKDTALFVASARSIVLELIRRLQTNDMM